jgi:hypothetical protein
MILYRFYSAKISILQKMNISLTIFNFLPFSYYKNEILKKEKNKRVARLIPAQGRNPQDGRLAPTAS